jgi:hypothetical protein
MRRPCTSCASPCTPLLHSSPAHFSCTHLLHRFAALFSCISPLRSSQASCPRPTLHHKPYLLPSTFCGTHALRVYVCARGSLSVCARTRASVCVYVCSYVLVCVCVACVCLCVPALKSRAPLPRTGCGSSRTTRPPPGPPARRRAPARPGSRTRRRRPTAPTGGRCAQRAARVRARIHTALLIPGGTEAGRGRGATGQEEAREGVVVFVRACVCM